jgi:solute:Na+ symporter, SSS family
MHIVDWIIIGTYVLAAVGYGLYFTKKAARSTDDFFVAGRTLPWYIAGTSLVAATFSSDTPLMVAGMSRQIGISWNWFWWAFALGNIATVFFFAKLWRRTEAVTDIEFISQRYEPSKAVSVLRVFKVFYDGVLINCVVMGSITLAMSKILIILLHLSDKPVFTMPIFGAISAPTIILIILGITVLIYTVTAGLYGVVYLDTIQFILAMIGAIALCIFVYSDASGGEGVVAKITSSPDYKDGLLSFFPDLSSFNLATFTFFIFITMIWLSQAPGGYFYVQRLLATRSERDSVFAFLWYNILHYIVRSWPWILVGMLSLYYIPKFTDPDTIYPQMIDKFLPIGLKGIMAASLLAAFTSSINTSLNWGSSYLINDFYMPFVAKGKSQKHYVLVSRIATVLLTFAALLVTLKLTRIFEAYKYIGLIMGGLGPVLILRWYWWRVTAWSEISALVATLIVSTFLVNSHNPWFSDANGKDHFSVRLCITLLTVTPIWVIVTFLASREPKGRVLEFYKKMKISGPGWHKVQQMTGVEPFKGEFRVNSIAWLSCVIFILSLVIGIGKLLFHEWATVVLCGVIAAISGYVLKQAMAKMDKFLGGTDSKQPASSAEGCVQSVQKEC